MLSIIETNESSVKLKEGIKDIDVAKIIIKDIDIASGNCKGQGPRAKLVLIQRKLTILMTR